MEECFNCGISETKALLFDAILPEGIVKICGKCSFEKNIPLIKSGFSFQNEKKQSVYERMKKISGVNLSKLKNEEKEQEISLRNIVDDNFEKNFGNDLNVNYDLVDNFHWVIMRARRFKKLTQEQLAKEINKSTNAIVLIEKGFVPEDKEILNKIENCLGIKIKKNNLKTKQEDNFLDKLVQNKEYEKKQITDFNFKSVKNLTISDLQEMKKEKDEKF